LFRLRHSSVSGFPIRALAIACHATRPTPPSSNRTCGFPASGSPGSSRLGHSPRISLPWLGLSTQPRPQKGEVFRSRASAQAVLLSSRLKHASSKAPSLHGHYPASPLLWASPTPAQVRLPVMSSLGRLTPDRASQVPRLFFRRTPSPSTPESPAVALSRFFTAGAGFISSGRLATLIGVTRPNRVRSRYGLRLCRSRLRRDGLLRPALDGLHV
jgi:hypothetical protein